MKWTVIILLSCGFVAVSPGAERLVPSQYAKIQEAIDAAQDGNVVIVQPGTYHESIRFRGKAITVRAGDPDSWQTRGKTVIAGWKTMSTCVTFDQGETNASVLEGFKLWRAYHGSTVQSSAGPFWMPAEASFASTALRQSGTAGLKPIQPAMAGA